MKVRLGGRNYPHSLGRARISQLNRIILNRLENYPPPKHLQAGLHPIRRRFVASDNGFIRKWRICCNLFEQSGSTDLERPRELLNDGDSGIPPAPFNVTYVGAMNVCPVGIILLAPALLLAKRTNIPGKAKAYVHGCISSAM